MGQADREMRRESYGKIHTLYRRNHGLVEYRALQAFARAAKLLGM
jgi:hypothetical protein